MAAKTYVVDPGGTTRRIKTLPAIDSSGTERKIKRGWVIDTAGTPRLFFGAIDDFQIGAQTPGGGLVGYVDGQYGSITPNNLLSDGNTVEAVTYGNVQQVVRLTLGGFSVDPGSGYLQYLIFSTSQFNGVDAGYTYASGQATWKWGGVTPTGISPGVQVFCEIARN